ncbi:hypothetical protein K458DRAFT_64230 [Lentithecium fluviatile CBS 122367]|uniref:Uncharacterized protein n=1 Tax=Lentithecium fluviatile CBS 122367 TaxID=1168545 RepID=A0A6G1JL56_9PLEO|nr:hypothetical protein K458DRAFT_64230 [Lentithecium fluviatile CBS 122367]
MGRVRSRFQVTTRRARTTSRLSPRRGTRGAKERGIIPPANARYEIGEIAPHCGRYGHGGQWGEYTQCCGSYFNPWCKCCCPPSLLDSRSHADLREPSFAMGIAIGMHYSASRAFGALQGPACASAHIWREANQAAFVVPPLSDLCIGHPVAELSSASPSRAEVGTAARLGLAHITNTSNEFEFPSW